MTDKPDMNDLLREARGIVLPEPKTKREKKAQHDEMNRRLRAARGFTVNTKPEEDNTDA